MHRGLRVSGVIEQGCSFFLSLALPILVSLSVKAEVSNSISDINDLKKFLAERSEDRVFDDRNETKLYSSSISEILQSFDPQLRSHYIIMKSSQSLQAATADDPRIIQYHPETKFIAAFNGHPRLAGFDSLEMIQADEASGTFTFFEIKESNVGGKSRVSLSGPNPALCLACHGHDPRPNWDNYANWRGAVGEKDDNIMDINISPADERSPHRSLWRFLKEAKSHERYSSLGPFPIANIDLAGISQELVAKDLSYLDTSYYPTTYWVNGTHGRGPVDYSKLPEEWLDHVTNLRGRTLREFTQLVGAINLKRIARMIAQHPMAKLTTLASYAMLTNCGSPEEFAIVEGAGGERRFEPFQQQMSALMRRGYFDSAAEDELKFISRLKFVLEPVMPESQDFSMNFDRSDNRFTTPSGDFFHTLTNELRRIEPSLLGTTCEEVKGLFAEAKTARQKVQ
ncbi:MAG: hypothetical protein COT74_13830 [Bdellovibrionales bacterium CG10_big_fil_rev_8_21_14_0_10_45_34]|nr:MAG: hypothetical protein COT74_13830 [Bdellovibrionales bacterium CG10_big_fil_rev_8_21_14_0_10_45_34]